MAETEPNIALLNLMPSKAMESTERQWQALMGVNIFTKFDDDPRELSGCAGTELQDYVPFSEAVSNGIDALVITGANLELTQPKHAKTSSLLPFENISYYCDLLDVVDWAQTNTRLTVYSCLASHVALNHLFGLERERGDQKVLGVFDHDVISPSALTVGCGDKIAAPQSRWGAVPTKYLLDTDVSVVAAHQDAGWFLAEQARGDGSKNVFLQGHPEYDHYDLHEEYLRDRSGSPQLPEQYYPDNDPTQMPTYAWEVDARRLFANIKAASSS